MSWIARLVRQPRARQSHLPGPGQRVRKEAGVRAALVRSRLSELRDWLAASPDWILIDGASRYQFLGTAWWCQTFYVHGEAKVVLMTGFQRRRAVMATIVELGAPDAESMLSQFVRRSEDLLRGNG